MFPIGDISEVEDPDSVDADITVEEVVDQLALIIGEGRFERFLHTKYHAENQES